MPECHQSLASPCFGSTVSVGISTVESDSVNVVRSFTGRTNEDTTSSFVTRNFYTSIYRYISALVSALSRIEVMQMAQAEENGRFWTGGDARPGPFHRDNLPSTEFPRVEHPAEHGEDCNEWAGHNLFFYFCIVFASVCRKLDSILCLRLHTAC